MPAIEHYGRSGWPLAALPGAFAAGAMLILGWALRGLYRVINSLDARPRARWKAFSRDHPGERKPEAA